MKLNKFTKQLVLFVLVALVLGFGIFSTYALIQMPKISTQPVGAPAHKKVTKQKQAESIVSTLEKTASTSAIATPQTTDAVVTPVTASLETEQTTLPAQPSNPVSPVVDPSPAPIPDPEPNPNPEPSLICSIVTILLPAICR